MRPVFSVVMPTYGVEKYIEKAIRSVQAQTFENWELLVIDDFGLMELDLDKYRDLFEVLDTRDGRKSTVVIS